MIKNSITAYNDFKKNFEQLSYRHSYAETFSHFLDFALWMLDVNKSFTDAAYLEDIYKPEEGRIMAEMFLNWRDACDNDGEGFKDVLGDLFMEFVSHGRNGQFFTPPDVCQMITELAMAEQPEQRETVTDPACGSGRMILAAAKRNRHLRCYGADSDLVCCKMAALNMIVNTVAGEVAHMNSWKSTIPLTLNCYSI